MPKISVTYIAPKDDSPVVTTRGVRFFDGQAQEFDYDEHKELITKANGNPHFKVEGDIPEDKPRRGRPPKPAPEEKPSEDDPKRDE